MPRCSELSCSQWEIFFNVSLLVRRTVTILFTILRCYLLICSSRNRCQLVSIRYIRSYRPYNNLDMFINGDVLF